MKFNRAIFDGIEPFCDERQNKVRFEIDEQTTGFIGEKLRTEFSDVLNQPIPDRFIALIMQLELNDSVKMMACSST